MNTALQAYDQLGIPLEDLTVALRTDEQTLFCDWEKTEQPELQHLLLGGRQLPVAHGRDGVDDAAPGGGDPAEIVVPHVMREVTAADCNPDRVTPTVSGTSLVPGRGPGVDVPGRMTDQRSGGGRRPGTWSSSCGASPGSSGRFER